MTLKTISLCLWALLSLPALAQTADYQTLPLKRFTNGETVSLADLPDKPTYLKFWASWCKPCMKQMPHFEKVAQEYGSKINVVGININVNETPERIREVVDRFDLSMPIWLDKQGELGSALGLVGTPYSVLLNARGQVLYTTHKAGQPLDKRLAVLASDQGPSLQAEKLPAPEQTQQQLAPWQDGEHLLFFTATWCASYLADTRPAMAERCDKAQQNLADLHKQFPKLAWHGIVNHLWTDDKAVAQFTQDYQIPFDVSVDTLGVLFSHYKVRDIPALLWIKDGKIVERFTHITDTDAVARQLQNRQP